MNTRPGRNGGTLLSGNPKATGRRKDEFYEWVESCVFDHRARQRLERILTSGKDLKLFLKAYFWAVNRLYGKPDEGAQAADETLRRIKLRVV